MEPAAVDTTPDVVPAPAVAADCTPRVRDAWLRLPPMDMPMLAGFARIENPCATPVTIVGVRSPSFADVSLHETRVVDGVSRMRPAGKLVVPPGGALRFEPGGLHLMLMKPLRPLAEGDQASVRLVLADGRRLFAVFPVRRSSP